MRLLELPNLLLKFLVQFFLKFFICWFALFLNLDIVNLEELRFLVFENLLCDCETLVKAQTFGDDISIWCYAEVEVVINNFGKGAIFSSILWYAELCLR